MTAWKKRYGFRLKESEMELAQFLDDVPNDKRSVVIRQMLMFDYRQMTIEKKEQKQFKLLNEKLEGMRTEHQEQIKRVMQAVREIQESIKQGGVASVQPIKEDRESMDDESFGHN